MNKHDAPILLQTMAKEIERSFESPIILFTLKDYADCIIKSLMKMRTTLIENLGLKRVLEIVNTFHIEWLQAVQDIDNFKNRLRNMPREAIFKAIDYTAECTRNRYRYFRNYIEKFQKITEEEKSIMHSNIDIIKDLQEIVHSALIEKQDSLRSQADEAEYYDTIHDEIEELLNWLDKLYDNLAIQFCKVLELKIPLEPNDLTKPLKDIIDEVSDNSDPEARKVVNEIKNKDKLLSSLTRVSYYNEVKIYKVIEKIKVLQERISKLKDQDSSALMALQHKQIFLEEKLKSYENIRMSLNRLRTMSSPYTYDNFICEDQFHIFNHLLPHHERCRLVEQLVKLWKNSIGEEPTWVGSQSIISILSAADLKEVYSDDVGQFTLDKYGRKIYTKDQDDQLYQLNENNELVTLKDDDKHVYFYDDCGRYYIDKERDRVYKSFSKASEYVLDKQGLLVKIREEKDGAHYSYDNLGRYYINDFGHHIYRREDSDGEYEPDGLGNLMKIRNYPEYKSLDEPIELPENKYLVAAVGTALKKCLIDVILHQPADPIAYLASSLVRYRQNISARQKRLDEENEILKERILRKAKETPVAPEHSYLGEESIDSSVPHAYNMYEEIEYT